MGKIWGGGSADQALYIVGGGLEQGTWTRWSGFDSSPDTSQFCDFGELGPLFGTSVPHQ